MKKLFLYIAVITSTLALNSCSSDSESGSGTLTFKVNGVPKTFKVIAEEDTGYLFVNGYIGSKSNPTESVEMDLYLDIEVTASPIDHFIYSNPNEVNGATTVLSHTTSRTPNSIKGTFSATIQNISGGAPDLNIIEGQFSFKY